MSGDAVTRVPLFKTEQRQTQNLNASKNEGSIQRRVLATYQRRIKNIREKQTRAEIKPVSCVASRNPIT